MTEWRNTQISLKKKKETPAKPEEEEEEPAAAVAQEEEEDNRPNDVTISAVESILKRQTICAERKDRYPSIQSFEDGLKLYTELRIFGSIEI